MLTWLGLKLDAVSAALKLQRFRNGWPAKTSSEIKFFTTEKVQYRYRERNADSHMGGAARPTLVLTADPPVTLEAYDALLDIFEQRFRVIVVELPAMGFSATHSNYSFGFRETNDDLAIFLEQVAGRGAILAFSCVAGLAAVDIAGRRPELVDKLIVMQTADPKGYQRWKQARDPKGLLAKPVLGQVIMRQIAPKRMPAWYELAVGNTDMVEPLCACAAESFEHGALWSLASAYQTYLRDDLTLRNLNMPILSLWGQCDGSHDAANERSAESFGSNVTHVAYPDLGHFSEIEDPERVYNQICQFVFE